MEITGQNKPNWVNSPPTAIYMYYRASLQRQTLAFDSTYALNGPGLNAKQMLCPCDNNRKKGLIELSRG